MQPPRHDQPANRPSKFLVAAIICAAIVVMFVVGFVYKLR